MRNIFCQNFVSGQVVVNAAHFIKINHPISDTRFGTGCNHTAKKQG